METTATHHNTKLRGLHLLLTYECNFECEHCFVWGGPSQTGTMTQHTIQRILEQAENLGTVEWIYFEGGEPFLFYELLCKGVQLASQRGFKVGIVSNAFWASSEEKALEYLQPFAGVVEDLSISDDAYHGSDDGSKDGLGETLIARKAAESLGIPVDFIHIAQPENSVSEKPIPRAADGESRVVYRGRAAELLTSGCSKTPWDQFSECPWEDLRHPERVHVDSYGNLHICQGISMGNLFEKSLVDIIQDYAPEQHPVIGPLLEGGPAELARRYDLPHEAVFADACHLCYHARCQLRERFSGVLRPAQMYGQPGAE